jgi:hypothetical protein
MESLTRDTRTFIVPSLFTNTRNKWFRGISSGIFRIYIDIDIHRRSHLITFMLGHVAGLDLHPAGEPASEPISQPTHPISFNQTIGPLMLIP